MLVAVGLISVVACFGNFSFTYEKVDVENPSERYMAHITTSLLMFVIGISLIFTGFLVNIIMESAMIWMAAACLYSASVLYDFWDLFRIHKI